MPELGEKQAKRAWPIPKRAWHTLKPFWHPLNPCLAHAKAGLAEPKRGCHPCQRAFSGKSGQKPLKSAVAQRSGPFFAAHTRSVSGVVAESRYATLKLCGIPLRYAALTATVSVAGPALPAPKPPTTSILNPHFSLLSS
ncbi:uncharacterized protein PGTG_19308 [Puccinia graminis f. sp. tritici CRL 75-36-700-3]|uniref:Uncharacterized protein n=1 Tax=Puccinia graminis f. sp. tritici (strain CRL 75-36-700-3 / race SCCL) TaxID=418459 RepID=E3L9N6_PUCGT|nr:uncharacterized protein PGTG_19308 [Puccinia graminis f. sp. tritici CRL 75-36-700-3]EFP93261.1 hypothetical protein PGTG_19308 [Puccinia graminis f. sp. tritici CRL 75-36-700-3]